MAGSYLHIVQGDSYSFTTTVTLDSVEQNVYGAAISLWGYANPDLDETDVLFNVNTNTAQITISGSNNANITVTMNSAYTNNIPQANVGFWFLRATTSGGETYTLDRGRCAVVPGLPALPL